MGFKLTLEWFDKRDEILISKETSADLGLDGFPIKKFNLPFDGRIYDGGFDVLSSWKNDLQPLFLHHIDFDKYDYQLVFKRD
ncbi:colicin E3-like toxin immunity protein [Tatumella saanichensis]|uniref:colicin E3-like toxin immunity protein n=1 Tax=Tatumella saanichensis TaxID=480813 RepID=UPI0004A3A3C8|nr:colicin E3-like toxin immunity protein [Tatumella saanichensis]